MSAHKQQAGFTLMELMIAVGIIGILSAIAYPSYKEYVMKGRRADAKAGLLTLQLAQEKYRANCPQYATDMSIVAADYACDAATNTFTLIGSTTSPDGYYAMSIEAATPTTYILQAARIDGGLQDGDNCGDFRINESGFKSVVNAASGYDADRCW